MAGGATSIVVRAAGTAVTTFCPGETLSITATFGAPSENLISTNFGVIAEAQTGATLAWYVGSQRSAP